MIQKSTAKKLIFVDKKEPKYFLGLQDTLIINKNNIHKHPKITDETLAELYKTYRNIVISPVINSGVDLHLEGIETHGVF